MSNLDIVSSLQFDPDRFEALSHRADAMREARYGKRGNWSRMIRPVGERLDRSDRRRLASKHLGYVVATLFYEPSTRTRKSFEAAASRVGAGIISTENAKEFSSAAKGETLEDTIRTVDRYADAIVLRHDVTGAAARAAQVSRVPIINAGDGKGEHPTQAALDVNTIQRAKGRLQDLSIVMGGDLAHGRTVRSLSQAMAMYPNNRITFVSTPELRMGDDIKAQLKANGTEFEETDDMHAAVRGADVVYWTRLQKERLKDASLESSFSIGRTVLGEMMQDAVIMHPLPRVGEIQADIDDDPRAIYFDQVENGLYVRMAMLDAALSGQSVANPYVQTQETPKDIPLPQAFVA